jgi:hypothetical protein
VINMMPTGSIGAGSRQEELMTVPAGDSPGRLVVPPVSLDPLVTAGAEGKLTDVNDATVRVTGAGTGSRL